MNETEHFLDFIEKSITETNLNGPHITAISKLNNWLIGIPTAIIILLLTNFDKLTDENKLLFNNMFYINILIVTSIILLIFSLFKFMIMHYEIKSKSLDFKIRFSAVLLIKDYAEHKKTSKKKFGEVAKKQILELGEHISKRVNLNTKIDQVLNKYDYFKYLTSIPPILLIIYFSLYFFSI